jgi:hypothetical protein
VLLPQGWKVVGRVEGPASQSEGHVRGSLGNDGSSQGCLEGAPLGLRRGGDVVAGPCGRDALPGGRPTWARTFDEMKANGAFERVVNASGKSPGYGAGAQTRVARENDAEVIPADECGDSLARERGQCRARCWGRRRGRSVWGRDARAVWKAIRWWGKRGRVEGHAHGRRCCERRGPAL